jgi:hypothetical protein
LSFIGSARVGWHLRSKLPPGTRCAPEHGGAAPVIIDRSADLDRVIEPMTKGGYYHAGQVCVSVQRIYVHADLEREFLDRFATRVKALKVGNPLLPETEVGPLILPREADRVSAWTEEAVSAGAKLIGGGRLSSTTLIPAIIVNPPRDTKVSTLEVFGPITCVYPFTRLDDAVVAANSLPVAFQASIFTEDLRTAFDAAERLDASAQRPYGLPHRLDAVRRPPRVRLRHRRHSLDDAGNDRAEDDRVQDLGSGSLTRSPAQRNNASHQRPDTPRLIRKETDVFANAFAAANAKNWCRRPRPTLRPARRG